MTAAIVVIFSILLILIFIELKKGNMIKHGKKEYILNVNTLIFNRIKYNPNIFQKFNKNCFFCSNIINVGSFIAQIKCKKHIYHYNCLIKWVRQNRLDKTNFFCPLCQSEEIKEFSRSIISQEDNNKLLTTSKSVILNNDIIKKIGLNNINKIDLKLDKKANNSDNKNENENIEDKKENISFEISHTIDNNIGLIHENNDTSHNDIELEDEKKEEEEEEAEDKKKKKE